MVSTDREVKTKGDGAPLLEQTRKDVTGPLAPIGLFDHRGNEIVHVGVDGIRIVQPVLHGRFTTPKCFQELRRMS